MSQLIDFLPDEYRRRTAHRKSKAWQFLVLLLFAGAIAAASGYQFVLRAAARKALHDVAPLVAAAKETQTDLAEAQKRLVSARSRAQLVTYLAHPWPRTQLLAAVARDKPPTVQFNRIVLQRQQSRVHGLRGATRGGKAKAGQQGSESNGLPTQNDLAALRKQYDPSPIVIEVTGTSSNQTALHDYVGKLSSCKLILRADLESIAAGEGTSKSQTFKVRITVRRGIGQQSPTRPQTRPGDSA